MIFLCPQLTSQDSSGTSAASFRESLATCTTGLWKEASTENGFQHPSLQRAMSLSAETNRLERQGQGHVLGPGASVFSQHFDPWAWRCTSAGNSQEVKRSDVNQTAAIFHAMLEIKQVLAESCAVQRLRAEVALGPGLPFRLLCCPLVSLNKDTAPHKPQPLSRQ